MGMAGPNGRFALSYGDVSDVSEWGDSEPAAQPAPLRLKRWEEWHQELLQQDTLWQYVGGLDVICEHSLLFIPPGAWPEKTNRGPSIGWPIYVNDEPVNIMRRFLDDKLPRYKGLPGRGVQLWPDVASLNGDDEEKLLVTGMRDASCCIAAGVPTWTTTGGVESWTGAIDIESWGPGRRWSICFDVGEEIWAENLADHLTSIKAKSVRVLSLKRLLGERAAQGIKDLADLAETESLRAVRKTIRRGRAATDTWA